MVIVSMVIMAQKSCLEKGKRISGKEIESLKMRDFVKIEGGAGRRNEDSKGGGRGGEGGRKGGGGGWGAGWCETVVDGVRDKGNGSRGDGGGRVRNWGKKAEKLEGREKEGNET